jgi:hypothetical protein
VINPTAIKKVLSMLAVALTVMLLVPPDEADARRGGGGFRAMSVARAPAFRAGPAFRSRPAFRSVVVVRRPVYRPVRIVRRIYSPVYIAGSSGCEWLRRRALVTGSPYWWSRYRACRGY